MQNISEHCFPCIDVTKNPDYMGHSDIRCPKCHAPENCYPEIRIDAVTWQRKCHICSYTKTELRVSRILVKRNGRPDRVCKRCGILPAHPRGLYCEACRTVRAAEIKREKESRKRLTKELSEVVRDIFGDEARVEMEGIL